MEKIEIINSEALEAEKYDVRWRLGMYCWLWIFLHPTCRNCFICCNRNNSTLNEENKAEISQPCKKM